MSNLLTIKEASVLAGISPSGIDKAIHSSSKNPLKTTMDENGKTRISQSDFSKWQNNRPRNKSPIKLRRGRKPGTKNKPKPIVSMAIDTPMVVNQMVKDKPIAVAIFVYDTEHLKKIIWN